VEIVGEAGTGFGEGRFEPRVKTGQVMNHRDFPGAT
jgi:hypothetical protein